jgi:hypothetical protein
VAWWYQAGAISTIHGRRRLGDKRKRKKRTGKRLECFAFEQVDWLDRHKLETSHGANNVV